MPRTETEMLWHVKGEFSQSQSMWKQIRSTQERTLFMATAAKTTTKPAGTPVETGVSGSELWKLADTLRGNIDAAEYKHIVLPLRSAILKLNALVNTTALSWARSSSFAMRSRRREARSESCSAARFRQLYREAQVSQFLTDALPPIFRCSTTAATIVRSTAGKSR